MENGFSWLGTGKLSVFVFFKSKLFLGEVYDKMGNKLGVFGKFVGYYIRD